MTNLEALHEAHRRIRTWGLPFEVESELVYALQDTTSSMENDGKEYITLGDDCFHCWRNVRIARAILEHMNGTEGEE